MKSQIKRFSKSTLSVILSLCMLVSCMTVGLIATDAAQTAEERVGASDESIKVGNDEEEYRIRIKDIYINIKNVSCSLNGLEAFWQTSDSENGGQWYGSPTLVETGIYKITIDSDYRRKVRINTHVNNSDYKNAWVNGDNNTSHNMITLSSRTSGSWGTYVPSNATYYVRGSAGGLSWNSGSAMSVDGNIRYKYVSAACEFKIVTPDGWAADNSVEFDSYDNNHTGANITLTTENNNVKMPNAGYICFDTTTLKIYARTNSPVFPASVYFKYDQTGGTNTKGLSGTQMTYDSSLGLYKLSVNLNYGTSGNWYYIVVYDGNENVNLSFKNGTLAETPRNGSGFDIYSSSDDIDNPLHIKANATGTYNFYFNATSNKLYVECPHTVTFDSKGGSAVQSQVVEYNGKATQPASNPTKTGYTFDKWVTTDGGSTAFNFSTTSITADTIVYAKWTQNTHSITYNTGTGFSYSNNSTTSAHYGDTISFNVTPSSGYRIASVKYNDGSDHTITSSNNTYSFEMPDADVTVSVTTVKTYTVTLTADTGFASRQYKLGSSGTYVDYTSGTTLTVDTGTDVYFKVTYSTGYQYSSNSGLTVVTANTEFRTGSVTANKTTTITASKINYTVTLNKNASDATAGTASVTATYGDAMPTASVTMPTRTGYTFAGYYDTSAATGGTQYYTAAGASARTWNKTSNTTLYARWTEITGGAIAKAYTSGSASSTGGTVKVGASGTAGATANLSAIGIASSNTVIATKGSHYDFAGWQFSGTKCANLRYRFSDSGAWLTPAAGTTYGTASNTTIYIKTDGSTGITTANAEIHALFTPTQYSLTGVTSPSGKGTVTFYSDSGCTTLITKAIYHQIVYAKYTPGGGYVLKSFSVSGTGASLGTRSGNIIPVTVGSSNVVVTATVVLQYSVTYYVDMHGNEINSLSFAVVDSDSTTSSVIKDNDNVDCKATLGDAQGKYQLTKQGSSKVYAATITTPVTLSGSTYSDLYFRITFNGTDYIKKISGGNTSATNCIVDDLINSGEIWLEAENESSQTLNINYSTAFNPESGSTPAVATGYRRIYLAKPYSWQNDNPDNWKNIKVYHWGNYNDMGWNNGLPMTYLGYGKMPGADSESTDVYHYYYIDLPKYVNQDRTLNLNTDGTGNKVQNIIFQGWADNASSPSVQTGNIEKIPDSANFYILSKDGSAYNGTASDSSVVIPTFARRASNVAMNVGQTGVNIAPVNTGAKVTYTSSNPSKVSVSDTGDITASASTVGETNNIVTITVKVYGSIGEKISDTENGGGEPHNGADAVIYTVRVSVHDPSKFNGFEIMSLESKTYEVKIPNLDSNGEPVDTGGTLPGYFDMSNVVMTVEGIHGVTSSTNSAIITQTLTASVSGVGTVCTAFTVQYAKANSLFENYDNISIIGKVTTKSIRRDGGDRYGHDHWEEDGTTKTYTTSRVIDNGIETATTEGIPFDNTKTTYSDIFAAYQYVDVTFTFNYDEYKPKKVDAEGNVVADDDDGMIQYPYDASWANNEDSSNAQLYGRSHTTKTFVVQNYEVRYSPEKGETFAGNLKNAATIALGIGPSNNYYDYELPDTVSATTPSNYKATSTVNLIQSVKQYKVYLNGELKPRSNPNDPNDNRTYYYYQEYAEPSVENPANWYAVDDRNSTDTTNAPLLATGVNSYKFRVKGSAKSTNTYLRTAAATNPHGNDFLRSEVDFSHYEVTHQGSNSENMKEYLMQNFYIADFFSPAEVLDPNSNNGQGNLPYDDAQFVGGGVVYYSMNGATENNQGTPFANAVSSGYVNGDSSSADYGKINDTAIKEMLKSNIEAQYAKDNIAGTVGEEDAMKAAYGTEIAATKNVEGGFNTGIIYRYLPLNQYTRYGSDEKTVDITVNNGSNITNYTLTTKDQTTKKWGYSISQTSTDDPEIANGKRTIRFTNIQNWDAVFVHFWGGSSASNWPGIRMTDKDNNVFEAVIPADATQIVFNDGCSMPATDENGSYTLDYSVNKNTFRYSNSLQSYQYVYASGNENKATNAGKNMRLYSYYVYSYVTYDQETNVPVTKYEIVLSDNYSDASTYWDGQS